MSNPTYLGIGIAVDDKNDGSVFLNVYLPESFPLYTGELTDAINKNERVVKDSKGVERKVTLFTQVGVKATWIKDGNSTYAPNIRKGEQVKVYEIIDTNRYFWEIAGRNNELRRTERQGKVFSASGASATDNVPVTADNSYGYDVDSKNKMMKVWLSKDNGEKSRIEVALDGNSGVVSVKNGSGLLLQLNVGKDEFLVTNVSGSTIQIKKDVINLITTKEIHMTSPKVTIEGDLKVTGKTELAGVVTAPRINTKVITGEVANIPVLNGYDKD